MRGEAFRPRRVNVKLSEEELQVWKAAAGDEALTPWIREVVTRAAVDRINEMAARRSLTEEGGVNESSSDDHGQQMSPLPGLGSRTESPGISPASTSPPAARPPEEVEEQGAGASLSEAWRSDPAASALLLDDCTNAAFHWQLARGEVCPYCRGISR